jgi:uncharacterized protein DUF4238
MSKKKRKQHYVWEHYLLAWATRGQVWCRRGQKRFCTDTDNLAQQRDFYRLHEMTAVDLAFVNALITERLDPEAQELARGWIRPFTELFEIQRVYEQQGKKVSEFEAQRDIAINNVEEDIYCRIEGEAVPILDDLRAGHARFIADAKRLVHFMWFIAAQYMRTPKIQTNAIDALSEAPGVNVQAIWGLMRTMLSTCLGFGLYRRRSTMRMTFLNATTGSEFITGDQPIINLRAAKEGESTELELYYPLAPTRALTIAFDATNTDVEHRRLTSAEMTNFNNRIEAESHEQVYAASESALGAVA